MLSDLILHPPSRQLEYKHPSFPHEGRSEDGSVALTSIRRPPISKPLFAVPSLSDINHSSLTGQAQSH